MNNARIGSFFQKDDNIRGTNSQNGPCKLIPNNKKGAMSILDKFRQTNPKLIEVIILNYVHEKSVTEFMMFFPYGNCHKVETNARKSNVR